MSDDPRVLIVEAGFPPAQFLGCTRCGVILFDADIHYPTAHPDPETSDL